jgi:hypothetical protein
MDYQPPPPGWRLAPLGAWISVGTEYIVRLDSGALLGPFAAEFEFPVTTDSPTASIVYVR